MLNLDVKSLVEESRAAMPQVLISHGIFFICSGIGPSVRLGASTQPTVYLVYRQPLTGLDCRPGWWYCIWKLVFAATA